MACTSLTAKPNLPHGGVDPTGTHMLRVHLIALALTVILIGCGSTNARLGEGTSGPVGQVVSPRSDTAEKVDRYLRAMESFGFSGAIIVSQGDEVVLREGYGLADRETRRPYTPATVQTHGSITKQMTAAAILLLESRGELSVDDSVGTYLDGVPQDRRGITLHQLLTHSSGLPGGIGPDEEPIEAQAYVERAMAEPLEFARSPSAHRCDSPAPAGRGSNRATRSRSRPARRATAAPHARRPRSSAPLAPPGQRRPAHYRG